MTHTAFLTVAAWPASLRSHHERREHSMSKQEFETALLGRLQRLPFQPFLIEFDNAERLVIGQPESLSYIGGPSAIFFDARGDGMMFHDQAVRKVVDLVSVESA